MKQMTSRVQTRSLATFEGTRPFVIRDERGKITQRCEMTFAEVAERNARRLRAGAPFSGRLWGLLDEER